QTEKKRDLLASMVESSDDAIVGVTSDGAVITWNRGAEQIFDCSGTCMREQRIDRLFPRETQPAVQTALARLLAGQSVERFEPQGVTCDGRLLELAVSMSPVAGAGDETPMASVVMRDITATKTLQKELFHAQKMEAVGRLAAGVAHDFNNLLTIMN